MDTFERPSLGQEVSLGMLYDARKDHFLPTWPLNNSLIQSCSDVTWVEKKGAALCDEDTNGAKFKAAKLPAPLAASILAGFIAPDGSGRFLLPSDYGPNDNVYHGLHCTIHTVQQQLLLDKPGIRENIERVALGEEFTATHVVTEIRWGGSCSIVATGSMSHDTESDEVKKKAAEAFNKFDMLQQYDLDLQTLLAVVSEIFHPRLRLQGYSDLLPKGQSLTTLTQVREHLERLCELPKTGYSDARAVSYVLTPVNTVLRGTGIGVNHNHVTVGQLDPNQFQKVVELFDGFQHASSSLEKYYNRLKKHRSAVKADHLIDVHDSIQDVKNAQLSFRGRFIGLLSAVRNGRAGHGDVQQFIARFESGASSPGHFLGILSISSDKLDFIDIVTSKGATYIPYRQLASQSLKNCFMFHFSNDAMKHQSWKDNFDLAIAMLEDSSITAAVITVDYDSDGVVLDKPRVARSKNGRVKVEDIIEKRKFDASLCLIAFDQGAIDSSVRDIPSQRKPVSIPCPGHTCEHQVRSWVCAKCQVKVEYAVVDGFLYCDCGRAHLDTASFNCQQNHGPSFSRYLPRDLYKMLKSLPTPPEINVLILGETGVGKSTFINSFINYLSFNGLDEALAATQLNWVIPCSFATQRADAHGRLIKEEVHVGRDVDEHDGIKGASATQQATVYPVYFAGGLIRLIDTPGIGDTRGPDQDRQNIINILQVLRNYDKLHGILILLKPNNARLTIMFKFCVKEILTQLHRNAANNMVFGFTNTRGSNYQAGDTFQPLETLLKEYEDVIPGLFNDTVYCFDSESFRYLAARHEGIDMGHLEDYRRSWDQSADEARRMVAHFQSLEPHEVRSTVSLNETRYLIAQLTQPMAQITTAIADTVKKSEERITDLNNTRLSGERLKQKLTLTKTIIESKTLERPKTVCSNSDCVRLTSDNGEQITLYKKPCHDPCSLTDVPPNQIGAKEIPPCAAFAGQPECRHCKHHWKEHQHVVIEYSERQEITTDPIVQKAIESNTADSSTKQYQIEALRKLIDELQEEHRMIQESQARFSHYLQEHSITHYNDATIEYYEHLIKDEKSKVSRGASRNRLEQLEADKATYEDFVSAMKKGKQPRGQGQGPLDEDGVYRLVRTLYEMKHYGKNLKDCAKKTGQAYAATFRERPYRVRRRNRWGGSGYYGVFNSVPSNLASPMGFDMAAWNPWVSATPKQGNLLTASPSEKAKRRSFGQLMKRRFGHDSKSTSSSGEYRPSSTGTADFQDDKATFSTYNHGSAMPSLPENCLSAVPMDSDSDDEEATVARRLRSLEPAPLRSKSDTSAAVATRNRFDEDVHDPPPAYNAPSASAANGEDAAWNGEMMPEGTYGSWQVKTGASTWLKKAKGKFGFKR